MQDTGLLQKRISIVIPLFNSESYIEKCLNSIAQQSYQDIEVVVVDDASTDASVSIVKKFMANHPWLRLIQHHTNQGTMLSRRDGYEAATGDFIMFVDSDDTLPTDAIEKLLDKQQHTNADIIVGNFIIYHIDGHKEAKTNTLPQNSTKAEVIEAIIDGKVSHCLWGKLFKACLFTENKLQNYPNMTISEDACLFYQLVALSTKITSTDNVIYYYHVNRCSSSQTAYRTKQIEDIIIAHKVIESICKPYPQLKSKVQHIITKNIFTLYFEKPKISTTRKLLKKHGMQVYGSLRAALEHLTIADFWFFLKRLIYVRTVLNK